MKKIILLSFFLASSLDASKNETTKKKSNNWGKSLTRRNPHYRKNNSKSEKFGCHNFQKKPKFNLHRSIEKKDIKEINRLLNLAYLPDYKTFPANPCKLDNDGNSPAMLAAETNNPEIITCVVGKTVEKNPLSLINHKKNGNNFFHAIRNNPAVQQTITELIKEKVDDKKTRVMLNKEMISQITKEFEKRRKKKPVINEQENCVICCEEIGKKGSIHNFKCCGNKLHKSCYNSCIKNGYKECTICNNSQKGTAADLAVQQEDEAMARALQAQFYQENE